MKFSVLIPTKNRLDLLKLAVESVRNQDYDHWELAIADNCSDSDVRGYVESLNDSRVLFTRADEPVSVTENWNRAMRLSQGDYVIMLGDDDALLGGYFRTMRQLIERFEQPDLVYSGVLLYACPNVLPAHPQGFVQVLQSVLFDADAPYWLEPERAKELVKHSFRFQAPFSYNSQSSLMSRRLIERMRGKGEVYQSPYPDTYATNATFLESQRTLIVPMPMAVCGITPKSYGYYSFNHREKEGMNFLHAGALPPDIPEAGGIGLPGNQFFLCWLLALRQLEANYGSAFDLKVDIARYRYVCMGSMAKQHYAEGCHEPREVADFASRLSRRERWTIFRPMAAFFSLTRLIPASLRHRLMIRLNAMAMGTRYGLGAYQPSQFRNILDVQKAFPIPDPGLPSAGIAVDRSSTAKS